MIITICLIFIISVYMCVWVNFRRRHRVLDIVTAIAFLLYAYLLLSVTMVDRTGIGVADTSLVPLYSYYGILTKGWNGEGYYIAQSLLGNVVLFLPIGILLYEPLKKVRAKTVVVLIISLLLSLCIETVQYMYSLGTFELDDLIHNTLGGIFGLLIAESVVLFEYDNKKTLSYVAKKLKPVIWFCAIFGIICIVSIIRLWAVQIG